MRLTLSRGEKCFVTGGPIGYVPAVVSEKPWKSEAILRLGLSLFICQFLGVLALAAAQYLGGNRAANIWLFGALFVASFASCGVALFVIRKPWDLDRFTRQFLWLIAALFLGFMFGAFATRLADAVTHDYTTMRVVVGLLSFQGLALVLVHRFVHQHGTTWVEGFGLTQNIAKSLMAGLLVGCLFLWVGQRLQQAVAALLTYFHYTTAPQAAVEALKSSTSLLERVAFGLVAIVLAPLAEEILFRGILYPAIKRVGYPKLALWGTSLFFALIHFNLPTFLPLLLLALVLTWLYEKTGNLLAPITAHLTFNALNFVLFLAEKWLPTAPK